MSILIKLILTLDGICSTKLKNSSTVSFTILIFVKLLFFIVLLNNVRNETHESILTVCVHINEASVE